MNKQYIFIVYLFLQGAFLAQAQEILSPEAAVGIALSKNYDIILAKQDASIATINNSAAMAGMLPKINATAGDVFNLNNIQQQFTTGQEVNKDWVPINNLNAGVALDWTFFDGLKMFAARERLKKLDEVGELAYKEQIQQTVADVLSAYFDLVRQKQQLKALSINKAIIDERVLLSQKKFDVGYNDKTALLQAKLDLAQIQINILNQQHALDNAKTSFNELLGREISASFDVVDSIFVQANSSALIDRDSVFANNYKLQSMLKNIEIAKLQKQEINAARLPSLKLNSGYNFSQSNSKAGLILYNRAYGPSIGLNANIPIFSGGIVKKQLQVADVNIESHQISLLKLQASINSSLIIASRNFRQAMAVLQLNEEAVKLAEENMQIHLAKFRLNQESSVEIKQAQSSYEDALYNVILARYNAKIAEISLLKLNNRLVN